MKTQFCGVSFRKSFENKQDMKMKANVFAWALSTPRRRVGVRCACCGRVCGRHEVRSSLVHLPDVQSHVNRLPFLSRHLHVIVVVDESLEHMTFSECFEIKKKTKLKTVGKMGGMPREMLTGMLLIGLSNRYDNEMMLFCRHRIEQTWTQTRNFGLMNLFFVFLFLNFVCPLVSLTTCFFGCCLIKARD